MGSKVKPRQQKLPRNIIVRDMVTHSKGGPMKDRREKRVSNPKNKWSREYE